MLACPDCATARIVQSSVWDGPFWSTLLTLALPLLVLSGVATLLRRIGAGAPLPAERSLRDPRHD
ncbi:MAG TPA: hypothetical protein VGK73_05695 [Polyangiaceae bacterium]